MTDKLNGIEERYEKINELLCSPDIISNQQEYAKAYEGAEEFNARCREIQRI